MQFARTQFSVALPAGYVSKHTRRINRALFFKDQSYTLTAVFNDTVNVYAPDTLPDNFILVSMGFSLASTHDAYQRVPDVAV
ncbi:MAG: hypothetical protein GF350_08285 [Chitinivibrionales bacterium]|nr:hypothetical protein [Chitinivibrionales bacterium]